MAAIKFRGLDFQLASWWLMKANTHTFKNEKNIECVRLTNWNDQTMVGESMCHTMSPVTWLDTWNDQTMSPVTWLDTWSDQTMSPVTWFYRGLKRGFSRTFRSPLVARRVLSGGGLACARVQLCACSCTQMCPVALFCNGNARALRRIPQTQARFRNHKVKHSMFHWRPFSSCLT